MTWARLDDGFWRHPKIIGLSAGAGWLLVRAISYSADQLTDGVLTQADLRQLRAQKRHLDELILAGMLHKDRHLYAINDYLAYNPSKADVMQRRRKAAERMQIRRGQNVRNTFARTDSARSREVRNMFADPDPDPIPDPDPNDDPGGNREIIPGSLDPPCSPPRKRGGAPDRAREERARNGSRRKRDMAALEATGWDKYEAGIERWRRVRPPKDDDDVQGSKGMPIDPDPERPDGAVSEPPVAARVAPLAGEGGGHAGVDPLVRGSGDGTAAAADAPPVRGVHGDRP